MDKITVLIGSVAVVNSGKVQDKTNKVEFTGEKLGSYTEYGINDRTGQLTDTRGVTQTLYRSEDGRLIVHVSKWSHWQGEPNKYTLQEVSEDDLQPGGCFEELGHATGFGRPLTLDEVL